MALPMSQRRLFSGNRSAGWQTMGSIPMPKRWLNGSEHNQPNYRVLVPLALPNGQRPAAPQPGDVLFLDQPVPRNLFPGRVQSRRVPNGW